MEVIDTREVALRIASEVAAVVAGVAGVCASYVPANERETVCGSFLIAANRAVATLRGLAPTVGTSERDAERFGKLAAVVLSASDDVATDLSARGWAGRFSVLVEDVAPGLLSDLEAFARAVMGARAAATDAANLIAGSRTVAGGALAAVVALVVGVVVLVLVIPRTAGSVTTAALTSRNKKRESQ